MKRLLPAIHLAFQPADPLTVFAEQFVNTEHIVVLLCTQLSNLTAQFRSQLLAVVPAQDERQNNHDGRYDGSHDGVDQSWIQDLPPYSSDSSRRLLPSAFSADSRESTTAR